MTYDLNDVELPHGTELIPDGSYIKVMMSIRPGGVDGSAEPDRGLLTRSRAPGSDVLTLDAEFTVVAGPYKGRKLWQHLTIEGGKRDERGASIGGSISMRLIRGMIDSAHGLDPRDKSVAAVNQRILDGLSDLNGITFAIKVCVEANVPRYGDTNRIEQVVLPGEAEYGAIMNGEAVPAQPRARRALAASASAWTPASGAAPNGASTGQPIRAGALPAAWERPTPSPQAPAQADATPASDGPAWLND